MKTFRDAMRQNDLVITAEMLMDRRTDAASIKQSVEVLGPAVDAVQFGDDRYGTGHMSPLAAANIAMASGLDAVVHLNCRDRNRIALQADILGAAALGVTSLVLARGEKLKNSDGVRVKGVFEMGAKSLIRMAGESLDDSDTGFFIGAPVTVFDPTDDWKATRLEEKLDAGARFLQTQPCLNAGLLQRYVGKLIDNRITHRASVIVDVPLLTSARQAKRLKATFKGAPIPEKCVERIASAADSEREGIAVCAEVLAEIAETPGVSGVNISYQCDARHVTAAIVEAGLTNRG